jgi:transposase InsO family protein
VLVVLHSERFTDRAPAQVWATLLDEGTWLASESTMYRLLRADGEARERRRVTSHPPRTVPELVAEAPERVWSYDATALKGPARGIWYDLFVMLDIFSRYSPGWLVVGGQNSHVVRDWIEAVVTAHAIPEGTLTIHADRGSAMTSKISSSLQERHRAAIGLGDQLRIHGELDRAVLVIRHSPSIPTSAPARRPPGVMGQVALGERIASSYPVSMVVPDGPVHDGPVHDGPVHDSVRRSGVRAVDRNGHR